MMLVSPTTSEVRWIVEQSFQRYFEVTTEDLEELIELPMIEDGRCIARTYRVSNLLAMWLKDCLLYTSPSPRDKRQSRMPSSA